MNGFVEADLPDDARLDSSTKFDQVTGKETNDLKKRKSNKPDIDVAAASHEYTVSSMQNEVAKEKLKYMKLENERSESKHLWDQWNQTSITIRQLRNVLKEVIEQDEKDEIGQDIEALLVHKKSIGEKLGFKYN